MSIENLKNLLPEYAKDLKLNLSSFITTPEGMTEQQLWGTLLVSAIASRNSKVLAEIQEEAGEHLDETADRAARVAAAIMGMNNIYYRFLSLVSEDSYKQMPAKLRMTQMAKPGVDKADFELWCLAVSAINGCKGCVNSHEKSLVEEGVDRTTIQLAVRIASVLHSIAVTIESLETG